ncbi:MAG: HlyD family secretion protein [Longimicrobiales bacterium]
MTDAPVTEEAGSGSTSQVDGPANDAGGAGRDPARLVTLVALAVALIFFLLYIRADRVMPYSDQARIDGYTVAIVPQVSGYVTGVHVGLHDVVESGQLLVQIDTASYGIAVQSARAALENTLQQVGAQSAGVQSALAAVAAARAQESITRREFERIEAIRTRDATAISQSDRDRAEAALTGAIAQREASESEVRRARAALGAVGEENPAVRSAMAALEQAELNLARTTLHGPSSGAIESLDIEVGHFAAAGQPLMALVSRSGLWIEAQMRENNLARLTPGDPVRVILDVAPGDIFDGVVRSIGLGVASAAGPTPRGRLPSVSTERGWLRQPQRFPVIIDITSEVPEDLLRVGAQATVMAFTGDHFFINFVGRTAMRFFTLMSYVR